MRLEQFILDNRERILSNWEDFARESWVGEVPDNTTLRNDAAIMLAALVTDMGHSQTTREQKLKSEGGKVDDTAGLNAAAMGHALARVNDGFDIKRMIAEFRAMRASVSRLWRDANPDIQPQEMEELTRFHEAVDQLISASVSAFTERVERSRRLFMGILGHDLRQPLYSIQMYSEALLRSEAVPDYRPVVSNIARCCGGMAAMLRDLLDFTSSQLGSAMPIFPAPCDLRKVVNYVVDEVRAAAPDAQITIEHEGEALGTWDEIRMRQLVSNLLTNAKQHGAAGTLITIGIHASQAEVELSVHNLGDPIPDEAIGILFDPMVRMHYPEKFRPHGSVGLGLYICRQVAEAHGGEIVVRSTEEGGTTFIVTLPRTVTLAGAGPG